MDTYAHGYGLTGHYPRPGTHTSHCGRELMHEPNTGIRNRICAPCAKAEQRDRVEAEQVAADHNLDGPSLAVRASVRYCLVGTGRRVHYSNNDDTLCGREVTEYTDGLDKRHNLCAPCIKAAEKRAYARALAAASPTAAATATLAETVEQADTKAAEERTERRQHLADSRGANAYELAVAAVRQVVRELPQAGAVRVRVVEGSPEATLARDDLHAVAYSGHTTADAVARIRAAVAAHIRHGEREVHVMFPAWGMRPALYLSDVMALLNRWDDQIGARLDQDIAETVEQVEDTEALSAAALVTEAEAADGTWRGQWIGEQHGDTLFTVEQGIEQGALFADGLTPTDEPGPASRRPDLAALDLIRSATAPDHHTTTPGTDTRADQQKPHRMPTDQPTGGKALDEPDPDPGTMASKGPAYVAAWPAYRARRAGLSPSYIAEAMTRAGLIDKSQRADLEHALTIGEATTEVGALTPQAAKAVIRALHEIRREIDARSATRCYCCGLTLDRDGECASCG
ncbi:hypothetical protein GT204_07835 [Streptomyces sp. SID4919]|uniref:hypothetical protein n=1 Tax=unclassified Streptomyces TaxID=2593676 RepID=UPI000823BB99|nr:MULTISPECIES: hypothetical protein [unclassified Streptomyces]MYY08815.1 hypothetical protein [Streptomyces sp. SID4919]SCK25500.1 hypothetical protein YW7DRAFT_01950 [Streptomyces sp. AmelKG-E11A]